MEEFTLTSLHDENRTEVYTSFGDHFDKENDCLYQFRPMRTDLDIGMFVLLVPVMIMIIAIGIVTNILSYVVLDKELNESPLQFLLKGLAVADAIVLLALFFCFPLRWVYTFTGAFSAYYEFEQIVGRYLKTFSFLAKDISVYMLLCSLIERYLALCKPRLGSFTGRSARVTYGFLSLILLAYNVPFLWSYKTVYVYDHCVGYARPISIDAHFIKGNIYFDYIYNIGLKFAIAHVVPLLIICYTTICLCRWLRESGSMQLYDKSHHDTKSATRRVISIIVAYVILEIPILIFRILLFLHNQTDMSRFLKIPFYSIQTIEDGMHIFVAINSSIKFFIYVITGRRFRRILFVYLPLNNNRLNCIL
jgi:hypothetical protein